MTDMKRATISFSKEAEAAVEAVKASEKKPISTSEVVRRLVELGYEAWKSNRAAGASV